MMLRATLLAAFGLFALPATAQNVDAVEISTSTVTTLIFNNGNLGGDCSGGQPHFVYNGDNALCSSGFLVGFSETDVVGNSYFTTNETGWTPVGAIDPAATSPYPDFPSAATLMYENADFGLSVLHSVYYGDAFPDVVLHEFDVTNTGATDVDGVYMGMHHDWDVGGAVFAQNLAGRDGSTLYAWDPTATSTNYFGYSILGRDLTGWRYETEFDGTQTNEILHENLWSGMTVPGDDMNPAADQRLVSGTGPYAIPAGGTASIQILGAAGDDLDDLLANVADASALVVADESGPRAVTDALTVPAPNPTRGATALTLSLDVAESVRVTVTDVLGRTVATIHDGAIAAGQTALSLDASGLAPGVYVVRAEGETFAQARSLTVVR